ncbi:MAG: polysaccharide biosynthesis tyrosine autokinase [Chloroflexota bacterium]|jgi:capsular exopolysaccharide synthesis family protein
MEIKQYLAILRRWAWLIILGAIVSGTTAYIISSNQDPIYRATARYLIDEAPGSTIGNEYSQILFAQRLAQTYVQVMTTTPILQETAARLNLPPNVARQLGGMISVSAPPDTQILVIGVEDTDPERAALIANTVGQVFIDTTREREASRYATPIANWEIRLEEISAEIGTIEGELAALGVPETAEQLADKSRLDLRLNEAKIRYTDTFNNLNSLQLELVRDSSNVIEIEAATPAERPIRPRTANNTLLALVVGAMAALGLVFLIEYLDDTIKSPDQILADTGLSTLGAIAYIDTPSDARSSERLITQLKPRDPISEAYRVVRTNLNFAGIDGGLHNILVTSASPSEGKSTTVANLAVALAQTSKRVVVVDADLRRPTQHQLFNLPNNYGLTTAVLDNSSPVKTHLQETKIPGLHLLSSGPLPPNPAELLNSQRMQQIIQDLTAEADYVLFDSPPVLSVADAAILAPRMSGCLLVTQAGQTRREALVDSVERLAKADALLFGVVINQLKRGQSGYYYDYYYRHYSYYGTDHPDKKATGIGAWRLPNWLTALSRR